MAKSGKLNIIICPKTGEECVPCRDTLWSSAYDAAKQYDSDKAGSVADLAVKEALIVGDQDNPPWAVDGGVLTCEEKLRYLKELAVDAALRVSPGAESVPLIHLSRGEQASQ